MVTACVDSIAGDLRTCANFTSDVLINIYLNLVFTCTPSLIHNCTHFINNSQSLTTCLTSKPSRKTNKPRKQWKPTSFGCSPLLLKTLRLISHLSPIINIRAAFYAGFCFMHGISIMTAAVQPANAICSTNTTNTVCWFAGSLFFSPPFVDQFKCVAFSAICQYPGAPYRNLNIEQYAVEDNVMYACFCSPDHEMYKTKWQ